MKKLKNWLTVIMLITSVTVFSQTTLSGKVVDGLNPVSGASVIIKGTTKGTTTGPDGNFSFQLKKDVYTLQVSLISTPKEVKVNLNKELSITIDLSDSFETLDEVLVS